MTSGETIAAVATGAGGALAVIRVSGRNAISICETIFNPVSGKKLNEQPGYTLHYGTISDPVTGETVDDVVLSLFRAPRSYTGEDMVEISCHGSSYIQQEIVRLLIRCGARHAQAGEFTVRAFLNGRIDLSQAEAVADMIASTDRATHALASNQMRGGYSTEFASLREELLHLVSLLELELDFGEEDVTFADRGQLCALLGEIASHVDRLLASFTLGNAIKTGIGVAIVGSPNAGKSTLLNALLKEDRAMVSEIAGTTRDIIEEAINIGGVHFRFIDTAGIRSTEDTLEKMGIARTFASISRARIVLLVVDAGTTAPEERLLSEIRDTLGQITLKEDQSLCILLNKIDKRTPGHDVEPGPMSGEKTDTTHPALSDIVLDKVLTGSIADATGCPTLAICAKNGGNLDAVTRFLSDSVATDPLYDGTTIISNSRHYEALQRVSESLARAQTGLRDHIAADLLSQDIREVLHYIGTITGETITSQDVLNSIFSKFCVGK